MISTLLFWLTFTFRPAPDLFVRLEATAWRDSLPKTPFREWVDPRVQFLVESPQNVLVLNLYNAMQWKASVRFAYWSESARERSMEEP